VWSRLHGQRFLHSCQIAELGGRLAQTEHPQLMAGSFIVHFRYVVGFLAGLLEQRGVVVKDSPAVIADKALAVACDDLNFRVALQLPPSQFL
jgi:hypothetical protein